MNNQEKIPLFLRQSDGNRFSMPVLFNLIERYGFTAYFKPMLVDNITELNALMPRGGKALCIYSFMTPHLPWVIEEIHQLREQWKDQILLLGGGPHLVGDPRSGLTMGFDAVSCGEGEVTLPALLQDILDSPHSVHRSIYASQPTNHLERPDEQWKICGSGPANLDASFPISSLIPMMSPLEISRGCHWHCDFCQTSTINPRHRSLDSIQRYIDEMRKRNYLFRAGFICPSGFEYGAEKPGEIRLEIIDEALSRFKSAGIRHLEFGIFPSELRPNTITQEGLALIVKYCSNRKVTIGAQSGNDAILKRLKRGHSTGMIERSTALTKEAGITPILDFIVGFPGETEEEILQTIQFARALNDKYHARTQMHFFIPLSGTPLEDAPPSFFSESIMHQLDLAQKDGVSTDWWKEGMRLSRNIIKIRKMLT